MNNEGDILQLNLFGEPEKVKRHKDVDLQTKVRRAIRLLQSVADGYDGEIEVAYSGGKDSDVCLELAKMAGIRYRAIYKNTTIDPAGTIRHAEQVGAEIIRPEKPFFKLIEEMGFPNHQQRFCCRFLKEYKVLDKAIMGIRRCESTKRKNNYSEPTECRFYGSKEEHVEAIYPILDWTDKDVAQFIKERGIDIHPLYYRDNGTIDPKRRLGCMCCPLAYYKKRIKAFKQHPNMVKAYIRGGKSSETPIPTQRLSNSIQMSTSGSFATCSSRHRMNGTLTRRPSGYRLSDRWTIASSSANTSISTSHRQSWGQAPGARLARPQRASPRDCRKKRLHFCQTFKINKQ